jgi:hypothetical protein
MDWNRPLATAWKLSVLVGVCRACFRVARIVSQTGADLRGIGTELGRECLAAKVKSDGHCEHGRCLQGRWWDEVKDVLEVAREVVEHQAKRRGLDSEEPCQTRH